MSAGGRGENVMVCGLRRAARLLSVASVAVLSLFFVGEGFDPSRVALREWAGLLFFPVGVVAGMVVGWRREGLGGGIAVGSLSAFYVWHVLEDGGLPRGLAFIVFSLPGFLFLLCGLLSRRTKGVGLAARLTQ